MKRKVISIISTLLLSVLFLTSCNINSTTSISSKEAGTPTTSEIPSNTSTSTSTKTSTSVIPSSSTINESTSATSSENIPTTTSTINESASATSSENIPTTTSTINEEPTTTSTQVVPTTTSTQVEPTTTITSDVEPTTSSTKNHKHTDEVKNNYCDAIFKDYDGTVLDTQSVKKGNTPSYTKSNPSRPNDENYNYTFSGWSPSIGAIYSDTTYVAQYDREEIIYTLYDITYDLDGGINDIDNPTSYTKKMNNIILNNPTKTGYTFQGWEYDGNIITEINTSNECNMGLKAKWTPDTDTVYRVEHYIQNLGDDDYSTEPNDVDNLTGTTDTLTSAVAKNYEGFTSPTITQVNINGDESTVMKLYYTRNSYNLTVTINDENLGTVSNSNGSYKYGEEITITATAVTGYSVDGWYNGENRINFNEKYIFEMPASNITYKAKITPNTDTEYKVEHYKQNLDDDNYPTTPNYVDNLTGTTKEETNAQSKGYEGFTVVDFNQEEINADGSTVVKIYYTRNSYDLTVNKNYDGSGTVTGAGTYKYGEKVTITRTQNKGYTFDGWYLNGEYYNNYTSFDYTIASSNDVFEARYILNKYTITLDNQASGVTISGVTSGNKYEYDSQINLTATNTPSGNTIKWSRNDDVVCYGTSYTFNVPANDITITIITSPYTRNDNKIYFGKYPQTKVEATTENGLSSITFDSSTWTSYRYYIESVQTDFMYYKDVDTDNNGTYDYRGVYFTQYRPYCYSFESNENSTEQYVNGYFIGQLYWFSYDPIEWNILKEENGKALLLANLILDSQEYYPSFSSNQFEHNDGTGYTNNYALSSIRKWLNETFYNTAFTTLQKAIIEETEIDNSASSTASNSNSYACANTKDNVFLLSYKEATSSNYGLNSDALRQAIASDYAKSQGTYVSTSDSTSGYSIWWLRSPNSGYSSRAKFVNHDGIVPEGRVDYNNRGIRPALWINL